jgi:hypothetical protein
MRKSKLMAPQDDSGRNRRPLIWWVVFTAGACLVALVLGARSLRASEQEREFWLSHEAERRLEARLTVIAADRHRPLRAKKEEAPAPPATRLPLEALARLEQAGDSRHLAAAYLVRGDRGLADQALEALVSQEDTPEVETDRAAALLLKGQPEEALRKLDRVLDRAPDLTQAHWNRALALMALDLPSLAARSFSEVARRNEPGWSQEASERADKLQALEQSRQQRWKAYEQAARELVTSGQWPAAPLLPEAPSSLRLQFYDAVRTRVSREEVLALLPVARAIDSQTGGSVLEPYVQRIASQDFSRRAPLSRTYAQLRESRLPASEREGFIAELLRSSEDDLLLGALILAGAAGRHLDVFEDRAQASQDPWFQLLAMQERAKATLARGDTAEARRILLKALRRCAPLEYRCLAIETDRVALESQGVNLDEAWKLAEQARWRSRASREWLKETEFLGHLAQIARLRKDLTLARAYLGELLEKRRGDAAFERYAYQNLAHLAIQELRFGQARAELDQALATGLPLTYTGALALAEVARHHPSPTDEAALARARSEAPPSLTPGQQALLRHAQEVLILERDRREGRAALEAQLQETAPQGQLPKDEDLLRVRTYCFTALIFDSAKVQDYPAVLELFERELDTRIPPRCALALSEDTKRSLLVVRGATGQLLGYFERDRHARLPAHLGGFVPEEALEALQGCEKVEVFARPPLHGRAGLLPSGIAWSYRTRSGPPAQAPSGRAIHLVVKDVALSPQRTSELGQLNPWKVPFAEGEERRLLEGSEATPSRVLSAMREATEIDLVSHGVISPSSVEASLVLAPEAGRDELSASSIRAQRLEGAPLVVLAACHGAQAAPVLHQQRSLPSAFIQAGARAVLAATEAIPDQEAAAFFQSVRERIRRGTPPAAALRDERRKWLEGKEVRNWVEGVLLFD